ncbi:MAG: GNAT family N-acetyltransferase [Acidimicrobiales bacterium]
MSNPTAIRRLGPEDWELLRNTRLRALGSDPDAFGSTLERELAFDETTWRSRCVTSTYFLAETDGSATGIVAGFTTDEGGDATSADGMEIVSMWVAPDHRRRGIATELVERVLELARDQHLSQVTLWVAAGNKRATATYERLGFEPTEEAQPLPHHPERCEQKFRLILGDSQAHRPLRDR